MTTATFRTVAIAAAMVWLAASAQAQVSDRSPLDAGSTDRRESQLARRDREEEAIAGFRARATTAITPLFRLIPSTSLTDGASRYGGGLNFVVDTSDVDLGGLFSTTLRSSYRTHRPRAADQQHFNSGTLGADLQVSRNDSAFGVFTVSGDYVSVPDHFSLGSATLEWDYNFKDTQQQTVATLIGTLGYAHLSPHEDTRVNDVVPGFEFDYITRTATKVTLIAEYTFKNDVDGEDDYAVSMRFKPATNTALRFGGGKHGRVFASLTQTLAK